MSDLIPDYQEQQKLNQEKVEAILTAARPDLLGIMRAMDNTGINWKILFHVINAMGEIATDTKYGTVSILIEDNIVRFIRGEHANKINESIFKIEELPQ